MSLEKISDIDLVIERKNLQNLLDNDDGSFPRKLVENKLNAILKEMKNRVSKSKENSS